MNMLVTDHDVMATTGVFAGAIAPTLREAREAPTVEAAAADLPEITWESSLLEVREDPSTGEPAAADASERTAEEGLEPDLPEVGQDPLPVEPMATVGRASANEQGAIEFRFGVRMEMATTPHGLELAMELPGVQERDIEIEVRGSLLMVRGELRRERERPDRTYRMSDRSYGQFSRSIDLPKGVRPEHIKASLDCGLLSIFIPNPVSSASTKIHIQSPLTYLIAADDVLEFAIAAPGVGEDELDVEIAGGMLTIAGRPRRPLIGDPAPPEPQAKELAIFRSIELPADVRADQITATLARGVLKVAIPNRPNQAPQRIRVQAA
jgi:HSP20 family protein